VSPRAARIIVTGSPFSLDSRETVRSL